MKQDIAVFVKTVCFVFIQFIISHHFFLCANLFVYYIFAQSYSSETAQTMALLSIILNEFTFAYNCRSLKELIIERGIFSNKHLNIGILALIGVQLLVFLTPIGAIFGLVKITILDFIIILIINIIGFILIELIKPIITKFIKD